MQCGTVTITISVTAKARGGVCIGNICKMDIEDCHVLLQGSHNVRRREASQDAGNTSSLAFLVCSLCMSE